MAVKRKGAPVDDRDQVISRIYDVALDPARFEELVDGWERSVPTLKLAGEGIDLGPLLDAAELVDHVQRADAFLDQQRYDTSEDGLKIPAAFDKVAALMVDRQLAVVAANAGAQTMLGTGPTGRFTALTIEPEDRDALGEKIRAMLVRPGSMPSVFRVRSAREGAYVILHLRVVRPDNHPPVVLAVTSQLTWPDGFDMILRDAFGLTGAEVDVARQLVECASVKEIAERRLRSIDTVRAQIKAILAKTEAKSQVELVRLLLSMMDLSHVAPPAPAKAVNIGAETLALREYHTIYGSDGRQIDYLRLGSQTGRPVIWLHLDYGLARWPADAESWAEENGLRIIVPIRAGYGGTDPIPADVDFTARSIEDIRAVLAAENAGPCPAISIGSDCYYAFQVERAYPGSLTAIIATAGVLPLTRPEQYERMHKHYRFILAAARYTPRFLPFMVKAGFHLARKKGKRAYLLSVFGGSKGDIATIEIPQVYEALVTGSEISLSDDHSAHDAFSRQVIMQEAHDWSDAVRAVEQGPPVIFFNGLDDPQIHPDTLDEYREDYPWIDFRVDSSGGQLLFFRDWARILPVVKNFAEK